MRCLKLLVVLAVIVGCSQAVFALDLAQIAKEIESTEWRLVASWEVDDEGNFIENGLYLLGPESLEQKKTQFASESDKEKEIADWIRECDWELVTKGGKYAVQAGPRQGAWKFLYFDVDDDILYDVPKGTKILVTVEYFDEGMGVFFISYVSWASTFDWNRYQIQKMLSNTWQTHEMIYEDMKLDNSQLGLADFRLNGKESKLAVRKVTLSLVSE